MDFTYNSLIVIRITTSDYNTGLKKPTNGRIVSTHNVELLHLVGRLVVSLGDVWQWFYVFFVCN